VGGNGFRDVRIAKNEINSCEVGIFLGGTGGAGEYMQLSVVDNHLVDQGVSDNVANYQKLGIAAGVNPDLRRCVISGNIIKNCNPANTNLVTGGATRRGIDLQGTCHRTTVSKNVIQNVGDSANALVNTRGIRCGVMFHCNVSGNVVHQVQGVDAAGIGICDGGASSQASVIENAIGQIASTTGNCAGVLITNPLENSTISENTLDTMTTVSGAGAMIYSISTATVTLDRLTIVGNMGEDIGDFDFIKLRGSAMRYLTVNGNIGRNCEGGIIFEGAGGSILFQVAISGNSVESRDNGININLGSTMTATNVRRITISGNTMLQDDPDAYNLHILPSRQVAVLGNTLETTGAHTASLGGNILISSVEVLTINGNTCRDAGGGNSNNIRILSGTDKFNIIGNILDQNGVAGGASIAFGGGFVATANGACIALNTVDLGTTSPVATNVEGVATTFETNLITNNAPY
jgi:hypothetical protein